MTDVPRAAGILFLTDDNQVLLLKRGPGSDYPGHWCFPGGHEEEGESAEDAAKREAIEELGFLPAGQQIVLTRQITELSDYTTFLQRVKEKFEPKTNGEHTGFAWVDVATPPDPVHPGCLIALRRLTMDELGVARAIAAGELTSPQRYQNVSLFDIRITGTGRAYRRSIDEHVWRDPSMYLNDEFLARCAGLPVIWEHPKKSILNSAEFANRAIGSVLLPYIKGEEVWGIAKIYDEDSIREMLRGDLSTSPAVVLKDVENSTLTMDDGSVLLVEGRPTLLDHIAICGLGVWDKGDEPSGVRTDEATGVRELVRTDSERNIRMADDTDEDKKAREDAARGDADAGQKLDKLLSHLDSVSTKLDAAMSRLDAMDEKERAREDAARSDAARRRDSEREEWMKADAEQCARDDAEEETEREKLKEEGEAEEVAADKARSSRKDRMDARRRDAEEEERKRMEAARSDSQRDLDIEKRVADAIRLHTKQDTVEEREAKSDAQARADAVYREFGETHGAPPPMSGENSSAYRRRLLKGVQRHSADWSGIDLGKLDDQTLPIAERRIYADAQVAARNPTDLQDDQLRTIVQKDPVTGLQRFEFRGRHTFIHAMKRPSSRVTGVRTHQDRR